MTKLFRHCRDYLERLLWSSHKRGANIFTL